MKIKKSFVFLVVALIILVIAGFLKMGSLLGFLIVFPLFVSKMANAGVNIWLARAIAVPVAIFIVFSFTWLLSFRKQKRRKGAIAMGCIFALWFFSLFIIENDFTFNPFTGEPNAGFAATPYGYQQVPKNWKVHPVFGTPVTRANQELATSYQVQKKGLPKLDKIEPSKDTVFFGPDGQPLVWYYEYPDGRVDLFPRPGAHPQLGVALNPVKPEIVIKIFRLIDEGGVVSSQEGGGFFVPKPDDLKKLSDTLKRAKIK